jgi:YebC/PmpR family DNA-binding regulatory protein
VLIEVATDNKNRTVAEVRHILGKHGGSMGEAGCVAWMFDKKGVLVFNGEKYTEDDVMEIGLEAGAEDVLDEDGTLTVHTAPSDFMAVQKAFEDAGYEFESAEVTWVPQNLIEVDVDTARKVIRLMDALEDNEDVQNIHVTADFPDEALEGMD